MASALSANSCCTTATIAAASSSTPTTIRSIFFPTSSTTTNNNKIYPKRKPNFLRTTRASTSSSSDASSEDCNDDECAPDKEVGKVSMEWLAGEKTKVVGTFPPKNRRGWTGYVEKDTAGQTNIYSVEPAVYVAESAISSGNSGSSADGAENTAAIAGGIALISVAAASSVLLQVGKNSPPAQITTAEYSGPSLSYYINKFKGPELVQASVPAPPVESEVPASESVVVPEVLVDGQVESPSSNSS